MTANQENLLIAIQNYCIENEIKTDSSFFNCLPVGESIGMEKTDIEDDLKTLRSLGYITLYGAGKHIHQLTENGRAWTK